MGRAPSVGRVFFPLDEELELLPSKLAPRQYEHVVHLACFMPFDKAAQMMQEIVSVQTNEETVRRLTEQAGGWMEAAQTAEIEQTSEPEELPERCVISPDGAMISLVNKQWVETRTVAIGEPQEKLNAQGEHEIHVGNLSYFSRLADASTFTKLAEVEIRRRKVREAKEVCAVMDGADWCQLFADKHRPDAVRVLDFPHAAEHINALLEAVERANMPILPQMLERCLHILKHRAPRALLRIAEHLGNDLSQQKGVSVQLDYLRKREAQMQYPAFRQKGWPIGSGMVESGQKNVVEARLKGTGMHWQRNNVNPMLTLRNAVCNDRWREMWQKAVRQHQKQQALQRSNRAMLRAQALGQSSPSSSSQSATASGPISASVSALTPLGLSRASADCTTGSDPTQRSGEGNAQVCICGNPLVRPSDGGQIRRYCSLRCSNRARKRAQRERDKQRRACLALPKPEARSAEVLTRASSPRALERARPNSSQPKAQPAKLEVALSFTSQSEPHVSSQESGEVSRQACICGASFTPPVGGQVKRYCSHRCRQRAYRQR